MINACHGVYTKMKVSAWMALVLGGALLARRRVLAPRLLLLFRQLGRHAKALLAGSTSSWSPGPPATPTPKSASVLDRILTKLDRGN